MRECGARLLPNHGKFVGRELSVDIVAELCDVRGAGPCSSKDVFVLPLGCPDGARRAVFVKKARRGVKPIPARPDAQGAGRSFLEERLAPPAGAPDVEGGEPYVCHLGRGVLENQPWLGDDWPRRFAGLNYA